MTLPANLTELFKIETTWQEICFASPFFTFTSFWISSVTRGTNWNNQCVSFFSFRGTLSVTVHYVNCEFNHVGGGGGRACTDSLRTANKQQVDAELQVGRTKPDTAE